MILRVVTAFVALAVVLPVLFFGGVPGIQALCLAAAALGLWEYGNLRAPPAGRGNRLFAIALAWLPILAAGIPDGGAGHSSAEWMLLALGISFLAIPIQAVLRPREIETAPSRIAATLFGVVYLGFTLSCAVKLRTVGGEDGLLWVVLALAVVFLGDTGAYAGGRALGRHKLHPRVSPGKTWEGAVAGMAASIGAALAARAVYAHFGWWGAEIPGPLRVAAVGAVGGLFGQLGDLAESLLKRAAGVKDSGTLFPGHGGMLDRIDALLFALPAIYFTLVFSETLHAALAGPSV